MAGVLNSPGCNPNPLPIPRGPGRPKGVLNKIGVQCKENIIEVFSRVGGVAAMATWARKNRTEFYRIYARLIPNYVVATVDIRDASELTDGELISIIASAGGNGAAGEKASEPLAIELH